MAIKEYNISKGHEAKTTDKEIKKINGYKCIETGNEGIFKIVDGKGGYLVRLDYGREMRIDKKTNTYKLKQVKTNKRVDTEREAKQLKREAEEIRLKRKNGEDIPVIKKMTMREVVEEFKHSERYKELGDSYKDHYDNYLRHMLDYFGDFEPSKITTINIEDYYAYQRERGNRMPIRNKDGSVSKKIISKTNPKGISINTLHKHKTALKGFWEYMIDCKKFGVTENVVLSSRVPRETIVVDGKETKLSKIPYVARSLTLEEYNFTLNDAIQHEHDRSIAVMIALAGIGGLRRSEVGALKIGKFFHNDLMNVSEGAFSYGNFDMEYYICHDELMLVDEANMRIRNRDTIKLPKGEKVRIVAIPECLRKVVEYGLEQREEILDIIGKKIDSNEQVYLPLVNILQSRAVNTDKLSRKWGQYQERRNKRMEKAGMEPIPCVRLHDLRHTHGNLLKINVPAWEISCNMGHLIPDSNTTKKIYWNDRQPYRKDIIDFWDENIKIDWSRALNKHVNCEDSLLHVNGSGHVVIKNENKERVKQLRKRLVLSEDEITEFLYLQEHDLLD